MDRRGLNRRPQMRSCRYRVGSRVFEARINDISWSGARLGDVPTVPEIGAPVVLLLTSEGAEMEIAGRVVHVASLSFGIKFEETRGSVMRKLRSFL